MDDEKGKGRNRGNVLPLVRRDVDAGKADPKNLPLPELWREWWLGPGAKFTNPNTRKNYERCQTLSEPLGDFFTARALEQWAARLVDCGMGPRTVYDVHWYILGGVYRWAKDRDLVALNPFADATRVVPPPAESHPIRNIVDVWPSLLRVARTPTEAALLAVYRFTGCRPEEAPALMPDDVHTANARWLLSVTKQRPNLNRPTTTAAKGKRGRGNRLVPVRPELRELLKPVLESWRPVQMTFGKRIADRQTVDTRFLFPVVKDDMNDLRERLGVVAPEHFGPGHGLHTFRHTAAFEFYSAGVEVVTISEWLGHENVMTTEKYLARMAGGKVRADPALDRFFVEPPVQPSTDPTEPPPCPF
jgi:integrase